MGRVIRYVSQEKKTMDETGRRYLSGVNCTPELAQKSFMATKNLYGKADGIFFPSAGVTRKAITWFLVRTAMFHHLRIKIWYAAAPIPGTTTYQKFLWIAIPNGRSYQKVINWPRGAEKVGAGFCPKKAFGSRSRQAKRSACPTRGWEMEL